MRAVLKMGVLKLSFGGKQYIISQRIRSLVEIKRQFRREFAANSMRNSPRGNQPLGTAGPGTKNVCGALVLYNFYPFSKVWGPFWLS